MRDPKVRVSRQELYELVWSKPMTAIAADFGVSSVAFAKHVERLAIPRPGRGYWQQLSAGGRPRREKLPPAKDGVPQEISLVKHGPRPAPAVVIEPAPPVKVAESLRAPHPLVPRLRDGLSTSFKDYGTRSLRGDGHAVLKVAPAHEARALRILDALFKALEARGHELRLREENRYGRKTAALEVRIQGHEWLEFWLVEHLKQTVLTKEQWAKKRGFDWPYSPQYDLVPSGSLAIETNSPGDMPLRRRWSDGAKHRLEELVGDVVVGLEGLAEGWRLAAERRDRERLEAEEAQRKVRQREEQAVHLRKLGEDLEQMATKWQRARTMEAFLVAVEEQTPTELRTPQFLAWIGWARGFVSQLDPLSSPVKIAKLLTPTS